MEPFTADWFSPGQAQRQPAKVQVDAAGVLRVYAVASGAELAQAWANDIKASSRLGQTPRFVYFPDGGALETDNHQAVDELLQQWQPRWYQGWIHWLESHLPFVMLTAVLVAVFICSMVFYGVPAAAQRMAHALPAQTLNTLSREALALADKLYFSPSELSAEEQARWQAEFAPVLQRYPDLPLRVLFRRGGEHLGANAFALPDGTLVMTDELVALATTPAELISVLAHEVGHVYHRHSLRTMIQSSMLGVGYMMLVGDASAVADLLTGLPMVATALAYSREHEREADRFAAAYLDSYGLERHVFVDILQRMSDSAECRVWLAEKDEAEELTTEAAAGLCEQHLADSDKDSAGWSDYFSTHPGLQERLQEFESLAP